MSKLSGEAALNIIRDNQQLPTGDPAKINLGGRVNERFPFQDDLEVPVGLAAPEARIMLAQIGSLGSAWRLLDPLWLNAQEPRVKEQQLLLGKACYRAVGQELLPVITEVDTAGLGLRFTAEALATGALLDLTQPVYKDSSLAIGPDTVAAIMNRYPGHKLSYYRNVIGRYAFKIRDVDQGFRPAR